MRSSRSCGRPTGQPRCQVRPFIERQTLPGTRVMTGEAPSPSAREARGRSRRGSGPPRRTTLPGGTLSTRCTGLLPRSSHGCLAVRNRQRESSRGAMRVWARPRSSVSSTSASRQRPLRLCCRVTSPATGSPAPVVHRTATRTLVSSTTSRGPFTRSRALRRRSGRVTGPVACGSRVSSPAQVARTTLSSGRRVRVSGREAVPSSAVVTTAASAHVSPVRRSTRSDAPETGSPASSASVTLTGACVPA